jgi:diacylglycerol kinase (ATP)
MTAFDHIAIIYNPNSTGTAQDNAKDLQATLRLGLKGVPVKLLPTQHAGHAMELAYGFAIDHKKPLIISASGDGGYNEVINGAMRAHGEGAKPICAVLPSGNANDHARTMQESPLSEQIIKGAVRRLDLLRVAVRSADDTESVRFAHSYVGIGLTPTVAVELNKQTLNSIKEALIILKTFWGYKPVHIVTDGRKLYVDSLICSIIPEMAKVLTFSDKAHPDDGRFELTVFEHNRKLKLLYRLLKGAIFHLGAERQLQEFSFRLVKPAPIQLDGEVMELEGGTEVTVTDCPHLLRTVV